MRRQIFFLGFGAALVAACGSSFSGANGAGQSADDGGADMDAGGIMTGGGDGDGGGVTGPKDSGPAPTTDSGAPIIGVFVSNGGDDSAGDGSALHPFKTVKHALTKANAQTPVVLCNQTFAEAITVPDGITIEGNYDCTKAWAVTTTNAKLVAPTNPAVTATNLTMPTLIRHVDITAPAASPTEKSSVGVLAASSMLIELSDLSITTGDAVAGVDGTDATPLTNAATVNGSGSTGGTNNCNSGNAAYAGGKGGNGGADTYTCKAVGMMKLYQFSSTTAQGASGTAPIAGTAGASSSGGTFTAAGFVEGDGTAGTDGKPGVGSKGSGDGMCFGGGTACGGLCMNIGDTETSGIGLGGSAGGCPGLAGAPGTGGGASIGVIAFATPLTLTNVSIVTAKGGKGGKGSGGSAPTNAGTPYYSPPVNANGTQPGISGSGAGGHSVCLAYSTAMAPTKTKVTCAFGTLGTGVAAFASTDGLRTVPASADGTAAETLPF